MPDETIEYPSADGDGPYYQGAGGNAAPDGNFVVAETGAGTKLMEWDATAGEWVVRGPVAMSGNDVTGVGALDADSVSTDDLSVTPVDSGTVTVPANGDVEISRSSDYNSGYYNVFLSFDSPGGGGARINAKFSNGFEEGQWRLVESGGNEQTVNWAVVKIADQP